MNIVNFLQEHQAEICTGVVAIICWLLPSPNLKWIGKKIQGRIGLDNSKKVKKILDTLEEGLVDASVNGDKSVTSNSEIKKQIKELKDKI